MASRKAEPGEMTRQIKLKSVTAVKSSSGGKGKPTYTDMANAVQFAAQRAVDVEEKVKQTRLVTEDACVFVIWYRDDIEHHENDVAVEYEGHIFDVVGIEQIGYREQLALSCKATEG